MKESTKRFLTEKKTILGFEIADIIGILLLFIPFIISLVPFSHPETVPKYTIWVIKLGKKTIQVSRSFTPSLIPAVFAVVFYASLIVRYNIFKKENIAEIIVSVLRSGLLCWTIASLLKPALVNHDNYISFYVLIAAVVLSWLGMKTIAGYSWILFIVAATINYAKYDEIAGGWGALFVITLAISLFLQIKDLTKISDFVSDFKVSTSHYSESAKEEMHAAVNDAATKASSAGHFVMQNAQKAALSINRAHREPTRSGNVNINFDALDVNKDGIVDEKDIQNLMEGAYNKSE